MNKDNPVEEYGFLTCFAEPSRGGIFRLKMGKGGAMDSESFKVHGIKVQGGDLIKG
ncbi:MAG: hypothetical protein PHD46_07640 [Eubacteriales bacterium]|jgi:hypothetical protein|nr:hypothetical protein [Eubacteriales bacterium]